MLKSKLRIVFLLTTLFSVKALEDKYDIGGFKTSWTSENHNNPVHVYVSHVKGKKVGYEQ